MSISIISRHSSPKQPTHLIQTAHPSQPQPQPKPPQQTKQCIIHKRAQPTTRPVTAKCPNQCPCPCRCSLQSVGVPFLCCTVGVCIVFLQTTIFRPGTPFPLFSDTDSEESNHHSITFGSKVGFHTLHTIKPIKTKSWRVTLNTHKNREKAKDSKSIHRKLSFVLSSTFPPLLDTVRPDQPVPHVSPPTESYGSHDRTAVKPPRLSSGRQSRIGRST